MRTASGFCWLAAVVLATAAAAFCAATPAALVKEADRLLDQRFGPRARTAPHFPGPKQLDQASRLSALRWELVRTGAPAVRPLLNLPAGPRRWDAGQWIAQTVAQMGDRAVPELAKALQAPPDPAAAQAYRALQWIHTPAATAALRTFLASDSPTVPRMLEQAAFLPASVAVDPRGRDLARAQLGDLSPAEADRVFSLVADLVQQWQTRPADQVLPDPYAPLEFTLEVLPRLPDPRALPVLMTLADDPDQRIGGRAASAIAYLPEAAAPQIAALIDDPRPRVREAALRYFQMHPLPEAAYARAAALITDPEQDVSWGAIDALAYAATPGATAQLLAALATVPADSDTTGWNGRGRILHRLGESGDPRAIRPLLQVFADPKEQSRLRSVALTGLMQLSARGAGDTIREVLADPAHAGLLMESPADGLRRVLDDPVPVLLPLVENEAVDPQARNQLARGLARLHDPRALPALRRLAFTPVNESDPYLPGLRGAGLYALGEMKDRESVPRLLDLLPRERYAQRAAEALGQIGDPRAVPALQKLFASARPGDYLHHALAVALGRLGDRKAIPALRAWLTSDFHGDGFAPTCPHYMQTEEAAEALATLGKDGVPTLLEALDWSYEHTADYAALALGKAKDTRAFSPLIGLLDHRSYRTRHHAAVALGQLGNPAAVTPLRARLADESAYVRVAAAESLWQLGARDVRPVIENVAQHGAERWERQEAAAALSRLGVP